MVATDVGNLWCRQAVNSFVISFWEMLVYVEDSLGLLHNYNSNNKKKKEKKTGQFSGN